MRSFRMGASCGTSVGSRRRWHKVDSFDFRHQPVTELDIASARSQHDEPIRSTSLRA